MARLTRLRFFAVLFIVFMQTVDAAEINAVIATFSIANRRTAGQMAQTSIEGLTDQNTFTLTSGEASADDDAYNDCIIIVTDQVTQIQKAVGYISDYTGSTRSVQLYADPLQTGFTMAVADSVEIFATSAFSNVHTVNRTAQTAGDLAAAVITNAQGADVATDVAAMIDGNNRVDVGSWLGTAVTLGNSAPDVNIASSDNIDFGATMKASINTEVDTALVTTTYAEPAQGAPGATISLEEKISFIYQFLRNRVTSTATLISVFADDGTTVTSKSTVSDDATTYDREEFVSGA